MSMTPNQAKVGTLATYAKHYETPPDLIEEGVPTWLTRGAHFVVAVSKVAANACLQRPANPDEHIVFLPDTSATIRAGDERIEAGGESVTIMPPGVNTSITTQSEGHVVRIFSSKVTDLLACAGNAAIYEGGAPGVAPFVAWPDPPTGFKLRHYRVADYTRPDTAMRIFRSTNLMINVLKKREVPRDVTQLSPHTHQDFEQASLAIAGTYVHHLRWSWLPDMTTWREDAHVEMASPSVLIVPPKVIHTSRNINSAGWLIDIFGPPRLDFSAKPGLVNNADEYPLPPGVDIAKYASGNVA